MLTYRRPRRSSGTLIRFTALFHLFTALVDFSADETNSFLLLTEMLEVSIHLFWKESDISWKGGGRLLAASERSCCFLLRLNRFSLEPNVKIFEKMIHLDIVHNVFNICTTTFV